MDAYETNLIRTLALIRAGIITATDLGVFLLPTRKPTVANVRANEWLRGEFRPRDPEITLRWISYTDAQWKAATGKSGKALREAHKAILSEQPNK